MKRWMLPVLAAAALSAATAAVAAEDKAAVERLLEDAQRRLEEAAREVAELSGEAAGAAGFRRFEYFLPGSRRAMLGVNVGRTEPGGGVRVESVSPGGPAAEAGVKAGDVIVSIAAQPVATGREIVRAMESVKAGEKVELGLTRAGKPLKLAVEPRPLDRSLFVGAAPAVPGLPAMPAVAALPPLAAAPFEGEFHWLLEDWGDAELVTLTPKLGRYFGADKGVLVARAPSDGSLGLEDGDVIVAIGGREPENGRHAMRILRSYEPGEPVEIRILRDRRSQTLSVKIPEREARDVVVHRRVHPPRAPAPPPPPAPGSG